MAERLKTQLLESDKSVDLVAGPGVFSAVCNKVFLQMILNLNANLRCIS